AREVTLERRPLDHASSVPASIVHQAFETREMVILRDALREGAFTMDPYVVAHRVRSVLGIPIVRGGSAVGVLYFENNLTHGAFSRDRAETLRLLSAEMGIALENSRLFEQRKRSEAAFRLLADASVQLTGILEQDELLAKLAAITVPAIADWCVVD